MSKRSGPEKPVQLFLRERREWRGYTQEELAARMHTSKTNVSRKETGERQVTVGNLGAFAEALDCLPEDLFRDPAKPSLDELLRRASPAVQTLVLHVLKTETKP